MGLIPAGMDTEQDINSLEKIVIAGIKVTNGSRLTNPIHQWPDPTLYINPAGQKLSGADSRNFNRLESANASHGRLKGKTSPALIVEGKDKNYMKAAKLGRLFVPYSEDGIPLKLRVAGHLAAVKSILLNLEELHPEKRIEIKNMPSSSELRKVGIGPFLNPPN